ncbi:hypothetical protein ACFL7M_09930 [Thermodesulfobacteriota bacterium]
MLKGKIIKICFLTLMLIFCLHVSSSVHAEIDCDKINISTQAGNSDYSNMHPSPPPLQFDPNNSEEISCGTENAINIAVLNGCPPFTWEVSGNGYSIVEIDERTYTLSCTGST